MERRKNDCFDGNSHQAWCFFSVVVVRKFSRDLLMAAYQMISSWALWKHRLWHSRGQKTYKLCSEKVYTVDCHSVLLQSINLLPTKLFVFADFVIFFTTVIVVLVFCLLLLPYDKLYKFPEIFNPLLEQSLDIFHDRLWHGSSAFFLFISLQFNGAHVWEHSSDEKLKLNWFSFFCRNEMKSHGSLNISALIDDGTWFLF